MKEYYVDLHVHVGRSSKGEEVKKATAANLTFENIAFESYHRKGIDVIGVVDCASPYIIEDIEELLDRGEIKEKEVGGRRVKANYGLNPKLGKYHRSFCTVCDSIISGEPPVLKCPVSEKHDLVVGVRDRIEVIKDRNMPEASKRAQYHYQVPLEFLPKVGPKTIDKLINHFGNEMNILHQATRSELKKVVKDEIAENIILAREGRIGIDAGGGGIYGRVEA